MLQRRCMSAPETGLAQSVSFARCARDRRAHASLLRTGRAMIRVAAVVLAIAGIAAGCGSDGDATASTSGQRVAPTVATAPDNITAQNVDRSPTATPAPAERVAAPTIAGAPIVVGVSGNRLNGPDLVRSGPQTWEIVNVGSTQVRFALDSSGAEAIRTAGGLIDPVATSDPVAANGTLSFDAGLPAGDWTMVSLVLDADGAVADIGAVDIEVTD